MKKEILQKAKGTRDFGPEDKIERQGIVRILKDIFESYGYSPMETPILERYELFASKFGQGEQSEAMQETFKLKDQGKRDLVLRNELTVPLARFIGENKNLKMPFKRYQIGQVFRDGPMKFGRYREFWQADIDIVGVKEVLADAELINIVQKVFNDLGLKVEISINNRKVLNAILDKYNVSEKLQSEVIISIDKLDKIGEPGVVTELVDKGLKQKQIKDILKILSVSGSNEEVVKKLAKELKDNQGIEEIEQTFDYLLEDENVKFAPTLARGLAYYTGSVFEVFLLDKRKLSSAVAGGGRYDNMISQFLGSKQEMPAVGISFGIDTIFEALQTIQKKEKIKTVCQIYVAPLGQTSLKEAIIRAEALREQGLKVDIDLQNRKLKKNLEYADSLGIPYVVIIGEDELEQNKVTLRDMKTGEQELIDLDEVKNKVK